jgi:hypothetical protein
VHTILATKWCAFCRLQTPLVHFVGYKRHWSLPASTLRLAIIQINQNAVAYLINCLSNLALQFGVLHPFSSYTVLRGKFADVCFGKAFGQSTFQVEMTGNVFVRMDVSEHTFNYFSVG